MRSRVFGIMSAILVLGVVSAYFLTRPKTDPALQHALDSLCTKPAAGLEQTCDRAVRGNAKALEQLAAQFDSSGRFGDAAAIAGFAADRQTGTTLAIDRARQALSLRRAGHYPQAVTAVKQALAASQGNDAGAKPEITARALVLFAEGDVARANGRYDDAEPILRKALALSEAGTGPESAQTADVLDSLANTLGQKNKIAEAEQDARRAVDIRKRTAGDQSSAYARSASMLALILRANAQLPEADKLVRDAVAVARKTLPPGHPELADALNAEGVILRGEGKFPEAAAATVEALKIRLAAFQSVNPDVATSENNLALLLAHEGQLARAVSYLKQVITIRKATLDPNHPDLGHTYNNLASLMRTLGQYRDAEGLYEQALTIEAKTLGPDHPDVASDLANLALTYRLEGRLAQAEAALQRALAIRQKALPPDHPDIAATLTNLGEVFTEEGRVDDAAEQSLLRAKQIQLKALGPNHPDLAATLIDLAKVYRGQKRLGEAEALYTQALAIMVRAYPPGHPEIAVALANLGEVYTAENRLDAAEQYDLKALEIRKAALGPRHPLVATALDNLAILRQAQGRLDEAVALFKQVLELRIAVFGEENEEVAGTYSNLASVLERQGKGAECLNAIRKSSAIYRAIPGRPEEAGTLAAEAERRAARYAYEDHVQMLEAQYKKTRGSEQKTLLDESFAISQLAQNFKVGAVVEKMAARFASGTGELASLVRDEQDTDAHWHKIEADLTKAALQPAASQDLATLDAMRKERTALDAHITEVRTDISRRFPEYAAAVSSEPVPIEAVQKLLHPDEALVSYLVTDGMTFIWVVRHDTASLIRRDLSRSELDRAVRLLRVGLDPARVEAGTMKLPTYDTTLAYKLYTQLFAPIASPLAKTQRIMVVADDTLTSLPLSVLVTKMPDAKTSGDNPDYRKVDWLVRRYALGMLPSVSSLRALRSFGQAAQAPVPFLGIGDPELGGPRLKRRRPMMSDGVDVALVRQLTPLPETAGELEAMSKTLEGKSNEIITAGSATLSTVEKLPVNRFRVVAFATHGLRTAELAGLTEPALVLTPDSSVAGDNGLLRASEIAQMHFNADWVVLSACNTAAPDGSPEGESLSGLAKAFFYAGTRAILVSHWPVNSLASVQLTTVAVGLASNSAKMGKAEALQRAMLQLLDHGKPFFLPPYDVGALRRRGRERADGLAPSFWLGASL